MVIACETQCDRVLCRFRMIRVESVVAKTSEVSVKVACVAFCRTAGRAAEEGTMDIGLGKWGKFGDMRSTHSSLDSIELRTAILRLSSYLLGLLAVPDGCIH